MTRRVIDIHSHMGDIFHHNQNITFKTGIKRTDPEGSPFAALEAAGFNAPLIDGSPEQLAMLIDVTTLLCRMNTAENISKELDEFGITYVCLFPVMPNTNFEEYKAASLFDPRFLPFTSADFSLPIDKMVEKLEKDIANGAYGLKIHPILQNIMLSDPRAEAAIEVFGKAGKPIVSHNGANDYYHEWMDFPRNPEAGDPKYFTEVIKKYPDYLFISAHAGGLMGGEMEILYEETKGLDNYYLDTTFRGAEDIKKMVELFGPDRVCFGTDRPFATAKGAMKAVIDACAGDADLEDKIFYRNAAKCLGLSA